jgi:hypothetical protein
MDKQTFVAKERSMEIKEAYEKIAAKNNIFIKNDNL